MPETEADIAIVGAGAAGLVAAIHSARRGPSRPRIVLLDARRKIGAKILMSGGARCNVTHREVSPADYEGGPRHFVKHVLEAFPPEKTRLFFEAIGVALTLEETGKYFPVTHSGKTVLEALLKETARLGVDLKTGVRITRVGKTGEFFLLKGEGGFEMASRRVILTPGGLSYPETGSDGTGYHIAKDLGHTVRPTSPALTPLTTDDKSWKLLSGIALPARLSFYKDGRKEAERTGSFLFTHFGFSGPVALDISRFFTACDPARAPVIEADFLPGRSAEELLGLFSEASRENPERSLRGFLTESGGLPERFAGTLLEKAGVDPRTRIGRCRAAERRRLFRAVFRYPLEVTGAVGYKKAEVTAGGVELAGIKDSTMESRSLPGLYFAGEILDVDGRIGGFNFQWAWSSGYVAGTSAAAGLYGGKPR
ncbi:MAG: NAD(P)/FAD-dependent oxidoreductase [Candidatus Omnitrophica bacterium]|nr:NAD(P)/FAD-dependent oxidoreductase [Candidatus Omnitrophota bacterium]